MQIERQEVRVFSAVVEANGFGRAAEQLGISQSAVSQAIAKLEHKVGTQLLVREHRPKLTEAGVRFLKFTQNVINAEQSALEDIHALKSGALSSLSLAMSSWVNRVYGEALLLQFCDQNPLTRLQLEVVPSREIIYGVDEGRWELGFGPFQHRMPGHFTTQRFFTERRLLVVHESHPAFDELMRDPAAAVPQNPLLTSYLDDAAKRPGLERMRNQFSAVWEVSHLGLRLALAKSGKGITYLSDKLLYPDAHPSIAIGANDQLPPIDGFVPITGLAISEIPRDVGLYYKTDSPLSEGARRFIGIVQRAFAAS